MSEVLSGFVSLVILIMVMFAFFISTRVLPKFGIYSFIVSVYTLALLLTESTKEQREIWSPMILILFAIVFGILASFVARRFEGEKESDE